MLFAIVSFIIHPIRFTRDWWEARDERKSERTEISTRCPANYWGPGMGPCICEGRVHPG